MPQRRGHALKQKGKEERGGADLVKRRGTFRGKAVQGEGEKVYYLLGVVYRFTPDGVEGEVRGTGRASVSKTGGSGFESPAVRQKETRGQTETEVRWQMMVERTGEGFLARDEKGRLLTWAHPVFGGELGGMMLTTPREGGLEWRYFRTPEEALEDPEARPLAQAVLEAYRNQG